MSENLDIDKISDWAACVITLGRIPKLRLKSSAIWNFIKTYNFWSTTHQDPRASISTTLVYHSRIESKKDNSIYSL